jgi:hypothetical protein
MPKMSKSKPMTVGEFIEGQPMIIHTSLDGNQYTRHDLLSFSKDALIDLILILNIKLESALTIASENIDIDNV